MRLFFVSLLLGLTFLSPSCPALAETENPLPADVLERLSEDGWKPVAPGVMQRGLGTDKVETLGIGAEGRRFQLAQMKARLASLREEFKLYPSAELRRTIRSQRAEILRIEAGLKAGGAEKLSSSFEKLVATGTNCQASYDATADAYALSNAASAKANAFFKSACGDEGEVYVHVYARGTSEDDTVLVVEKKDPTTAPNTPRFGSDITASASVTAPGVVKDCYSTAYASVTSYDPVITYTVSDENRLCVSTPSPGNLLISEFRFRGPNGTNDEFVELYNNTDSTIYVGVGDGSAGWAVVGADGATRFVVPNGTAIPLRGHYLATNVTYSLGGYATSNRSYSADIADGSGIALFRSADPGNFTLANRLDAVGYSTVDPLYREGTGLPTGGAETSTDLNYSFYRNLSAGHPVDNNNNAADFFGVDTQGTTLGTGQRLGAPGPENLSSPVVRTAQVPPSLIDPAACSGCAPNRVRDYTVTPEDPNGTLIVRRRFTNNTGRTITRLRARLVDVTTFPVPAGVADLRLRTSADTVVTLTDGTTLTVKGTTLENSSIQPMGGGWNSTAAIPLPSQGLAPGASVEVQFVLGVAQSGSFRFLVNVEAD